MLLIAKHVTGRDIGWLGRDTLVLPGGCHAALLALQRGLQIVGGSSVDHARGGPPGSASAAVITW